MKPRAVPDRRHVRADEGVLPSAEEQAREGMRIVTLPNTKNEDRWDGASRAQRDEILEHIKPLFD